MALDGITQVELANVRDMEISIEISEDTLRRYGMTFDEVAMAIRKSSVDLPGGSIKVKDSGEVLLRTKGQAKEVLDFEQIVLRTLPDGTRLRLGQVATLIDGFEENDRESYFDGERCALVKVFRVGDENAIEISDIVKQYITESAHLFPEGIALETWQDDSFYLAGRRDLMIRNGVTGFCLVFMVLALFLRFRLAFWVSLGIPISFLIGVLGAMALGSLLFDGEGKAASVVPANAKVRRVISLFMSGGPSQMDLLDPKPGLEKERGRELPKSIRGEQRITTMTSGQKNLPVLPSPFKFAPHGQCGMELSELLPHWGEIADDLCVIRSMQTEAINHDPAITYIQTGSQVPGRPSLGAWLSYGLGSMNEDLPGYIVMHAKTSFPEQSLFNRLWGPGFLPAEHQGVLLRSQGDPVLYLSNPKGTSRKDRRAQLKRTL